MRERHRTFLSALGIYVGGSWVVLQVVDLLKQNLGLPPWTFSLALVLLIIGLPIILATAWLQSRAARLAPVDSAGPRPATSAAGPRIDTPASIFTWRNAILGGLAAMALWGVFATMWLIRDRAVDAGPVDATARAVDARGPTGIASVRTSPAGVAVEARPVLPDGTGLSAAHQLGSTPVRGAELPAGEVLLRLTGPDLEPLTLLVRVTPDDTLQLEARLLPSSPLTAGMVLVPEGPSPAAADGMPLEAFLIDRHEVTNEEFASFVADDGYATDSLWPDTMIVEGVTVGRSEGLAFLVDGTGVPGPRTWSGSVFPNETGDHPVTGVSWYEARAYCLWKGKRLPSAAQWWRTALGAGERRYPWGDEGESLLARANFEAAGTLSAESLPLGVSPFGAFEMAGNAREWLRPEDEEARSAVSIGGSWKDPAYTFTPEWREELPLGYANETTGFRCARHAG